MGFQHFPSTDQAVLIYDQLNLYRQALFFFDDVLARLFPLRIGLEGLFLCSSFSSELQKFSILSICTKYSSFNVWSCTYCRRGFIFLVVTFPKCCLDCTISLHYSSALRRNSNDLLTNESFKGVLTRKKLFTSTHTISISCNCCYINHKISSKSQHSLPPTPDMIPFEKFLAFKIFIKLLKRCHIFSSQYYGTFHFSDYVLQKSSGMLRTCIHVQRPILELQQLALK